MYSLLGSHICIFSFFFANGQGVNKYFTFGRHICFMTFMTTYVIPFFYRHISFSLFMPLTFEIVHTYVSKHNKSSIIVL